jgi:hypothetical protein
MQGIGVVRHGAQNVRPQVREIAHTARQIIEVEFVWMLLCDARDDRGRDERGKEKEQPSRNCRVTHRYSSRSGGFKP